MVWQVNLLGALRVWRVLQAITYWSDGALMMRTLVNSVHALALAYGFLVVAAFCFGAILFIVETTAGGRGILF